MKFFCILFLALTGNLVTAQTNSSVATPEPEILITSDSGRFDGRASQMIYLGHVFVTDNAKAKMNCGQLTVDLPPEGGHPTNIVAETNVVIAYLDNKGQTNIVTANKAVYVYHVITNKFGPSTNETVAFTGGAFGDPKPKVVNSQATILSEPLIYDVAANQFIFSHYETHFKPKPSTGTNTSPFNFLNK